MEFSERLLADGADLWEAQLSHPFVTELAEGTLAEEALLHWVKQDYRYLLDYARVFALASTKVNDESTRTHLLGVAHRILDEELDLHRGFAAEYGVTSGDLAAVQKAPTCVAYTNFLVRTAYEGSIAEISAAVYPCAQGYLDIAQHMAELADTEHRYTPFIEKYTSEDFRDAVAWVRDFVDQCADAFPGQREAMREAFLTSARLEHAFWEMAYTQEGWEL